MQLQLLETPLLSAISDKKTFIKNKRCFPCGSKLFSISHNLLMRREQNLNSKFTAAGTIQDMKFPLHYNATLKLTVCVTRNNWSIFIWLFIQSYLLVLSLLFYFFEEISCLTVSNCIMSVNSRLRHIL